MTDSGNDTPSNSNCSIFELAADLLAKPELQANIPANSIPVIKKLEKLLHGLGSGETEQIEQSLSEIGISRENKLLGEIGQMARSLHNSLHEFKSSLNRSNTSMQCTNLPDATDKLEAVIQMTFDAANKTMTNMERHAEIVQDLKSNLEAYKLRLPIENRSDSFLSRLELHLNEMDALCAETLVTQSFQDLTGQSIKKVIKLVVNLEVNLVSLIKIFGASEMPENEGGAEQQSKAVVQDDVDALLSSFGF